MWYFLGSVLEKVSLKQTRFKTPGVRRDKRGVVIGERGVVLFTSLDGLVAFLRAYGDHATLGDILPTLEIHRLVTSLKTRELMLSVLAESSYRMDQIASIARLTGGMVFTGTARHFVKYRDAASPLGYDLLKVADAGADLVLYEGSFQQSYTLERPLEVRDLILRLVPRRSELSDAALPGDIFLTAETGLGPAVIRYLYRWGVDADAALAEWPSESAFDDAPRRLYLMKVRGAPARIVRLLQSVPGVNLYKPEGSFVGVELGYRHPIDLLSCDAVFSGSGLYLFGGDGEVLHADPLPAFAPVSALVRAHISLEEESPILEGRGDAIRGGLQVHLRLAVSQEMWRQVVATVVPRNQGTWLARLLYAIPTEDLKKLQIAVAEHAIYLIDETGIEGIPLGTFFCRVTDGVYIPAGSTLVPSVSSELVSELTAGRGSGHVFFRW